MNTSSLNVLHNSRNQNIFAVADTVNFKLSSHHVLVNQNRIFNSLSQNNLHIFFYVGIVEGNNHVLTAQNVRRTQQNRVAQLFCCSQSFFGIHDCKSLRTLNLEFFTKFFKTLAVFGQVDCVSTCTKNWDSLLRKEVCKLDCCTAAKGNYNCNRLFCVDNAHNVFRSERFKIESVCGVKVGRNGFRVVVDDCNLVAKFFQAPYALNAGIVELNTLTDADRARTKNYDCAFRSLLLAVEVIQEDFCFIFAVVAGIEIWSFGIELACTGINHFEGAWNVGNFSCGAKLGKFFVVIVDCGRGRSFSLIVFNNSAASRNLLTSHLFDNLIRVSVFFSTQIKFLSKVELSFLNLSKLSFAVNKALHLI